jgi:hypothetical protein
LPSGYEIGEDNGDLVVRDTNGSIALRRVDGGNWSFEGNTVETGALQADSADVTNQVTSNSVDTANLQSDEITNSGQVTTQDLDVTGTATGIKRGTQSVMRVFLSADSSANPIIFDSLVFDSGSDYDTTTGEFTAPSDGFYLAMATLRDKNTTGAFVIEINQRRGTTSVSKMREEIPSAQDNSTVSMSVPFKLQQGDTLRVENPNNILINASPDLSHFSVIKLQD